jgi:LPPG:FO 2-phospho-L-lactate transferase
VSKTGKVLALCGGVGGAKLAKGLSEVYAPEELSIVVNTADDFVHWGLNISPDLDSVMYKVSGSNDTERGWGRAGESWNVLESMKALGGESWFQLGDKDLAVHLYRSQLLKEGKTLTQTSQTLAKAFGIEHALLPMSDSPVSTFVDTNEGEMAFQQYFVGRRCEPEVKEVIFKGVEEAKLSPLFSKALSSSDLKAVIICPSNPFVSIDPILALPGVRQRLEELAKRMPVIAVSPIIEGDAVKGPAAKMFKSLGHECSALGVATYYQNLINGMVIDEKDSQLETPIKALSEENCLSVKVLQTMMKNDKDQRELAGSIKSFIEEES